MALPKKPNCSHCGAEFFGPWGKSSRWTCGTRGGMQSVECRLVQLEAENKRLRIRLSWSDGVSSLLIRAEKQLAGRTAVPDWLLTSQIRDHLRRAHEPGPPSDIERLRKALAPFAAVAAGIPGNWPEANHLRIDCRPDGTEHLAYHGESEAILAVLPTIRQWRETQPEPVEPSPGHVAESMKAIEEGWTRRVDDVIADLAAAPVEPCPGPAPCKS